MRPGYLTTELQSAVIGAAAPANLSYNLSRSRAQAAAPAAHQGRPR